ncbi:MAG: hypothetical protein SFY56_11175 [Bacteroidota bacterium]|nr:hypothetical protein [Bacteroidota bacterium]
MKIKIITLVFICIFKICLSQVAVGDGYFGTGSVGSLNDDDIERLKKTTTLFVVPNHEKDKLEEYRNAITPIWFFNPIDFLTEDEVASYKKKPGEYSYFFVDIYYIPYRGDLFYNFGYHLPYLHKGKKERLLRVAYIPLYTEFKAYQVKVNNIKEPDKEIMEAYNSCTVYNFTPAHMKCFLSVVSANLLGKTTHWIQNENEVIDDTKTLTDLSNDTLFIPNYVNSNPNNLDESYGIAGEKELMKDYKFKYKFLNAEEFENKIVNSTKPMFVFTYSYVHNNQKSYTILNPRSGQIIYSHFEMNNKISSKDFSKISKKIEKVIGK